MPDEGEKKKRAPSKKPVVLGQSGPEVREVRARKSVHAGDLTKFAPTLLTDLARADAELAKARARPPGQPMTRTELRRLALLTFCVDPTRPTIKELHDRPEFARIPWSTWAGWSAEDQWTYHRQSAAMALHQKVVEHVADVTADHQVQLWKESIKETNLLKRGLLDRIQQEMATTQYADVPADRVVNAYMRVLEGEMKLLSLLPAFAQAAPGGQGAAQPAGGGGLPIQPTLTAQEARVAAMAVLRMRREAVENAKPEQQAPTDPPAGKT